SPRHIFFLRAEGCRIAEVKGPQIRWLECAFDRAASPTERAQAISAAAKAQQVLLALPATMCLPAPISLEGISPRDRRAMAFRLEEQLPVAAEEFVCDFMVQGKSALAVAAIHAPIRQLIDALESEGISVTSIVPTALLAAKSADGTVLIPEGDC